MDNKAFMAEMQKRSGFDKALLNKLLRSTENILSREAINLNSVELEGLGTFEPHKRLEFIYKNKQTGEVILYPPRIVMRFLPSAELANAVKE